MTSNDTWWGSILLYLCYVAFITRIHTRQPKWNSWSNDMYFNRHFLENALYVSGIAGCSFRTRVAYAQTHDVRATDDTLAYICIFQNKIPSMRATLRYHRIGVFLDDLLVMWLCTLPGEPRKDLFICYQTKRQVKEIRTLDPPSVFYFYFILVLGLSSSERKLVPFILRHV